MNSRSIFPRAGVKSTYFGSSIHSETIASVLFDCLPYAACPSWDMIFFQFPIGVQGKTEAQTNLYQSHQLLPNTRFIVHGMELVFLPHPSLNKAQRVADINAAARGGFAQFDVQNRPFASAAPLAACPAAPYWRMPLKDEPGLPEDARAALTEQFRDTDYGAFGGAPLVVKPIFIECTQSFSVRVSHLAPLPSGLDGTLWCRLPGSLIRDFS